MRNFFHEKALHGGINFFWTNILGDVLHDQVKQGGMLMVKRFQMSNQVSFFSHLPLPELLEYHLKS